MAYFCFRESLIAWLTWNVGKDPFHMTTTREKVSLALIVLGIALGIAAISAASPKAPAGDGAVVYYDDTGAKHPDDDLRGIISKKTAVWVCAAAVIFVFAGFSMREK